VLLDTGARVEECARLEVEDFAITARTGEVRLHGKGDEVRYAPLARRARDLVSAWADPAQVQALLGPASIDTAARYFRAGSAENAEVVERVFSD
jgi:site-specific recombinase XerD